MPCLDAPSNEKFTEIYNFHINIIIRNTVVLTGARRVGKTTIEYQMIDTLIKRGVSPQQIVFISLDHPMLKLSG